MALTVKNKIWLGTLFLFLLLLITGGTGIYFMAKLKMEQQNVLKANYESLSYCHEMQQQLDTIEADYTKSINRFKNALQKQEKNTTEQGEDKITEDLKNSFYKLRSGDTSIENIKLIHREIQSILSLNMQAIHRKSKVAEKTSKDAFTIIISLSAIVFIIAFTFLLNFPSILTKPILEFTEAIKKISDKNYSHRIHIDNKDEFGNLANAFNEMAARLEYFEHSNLNKLLFEKNRAEAVINSLKDASIGIDKNNILLFANQQALQLLNLNSESIIGKLINELADTNDLFRFLIENETNMPFKIVVDNHENYFIKEVIEVEQGDAKNKVIVLKNITPFKELDVAKTNFIATVSHELKTPLAASDFSLKLLEDGRSGTLLPQQKELIENLKQDNQRMLKILSELLNMSQVETGSIQLIIQKVNAEIIIDKAINTIAASAAGKNITIKKLYSNNLSFINADEDKTTWVLNNFLSNAVKYSSDNGTIELNAYKQNDNMLFSVKDYGRGINQEYLPKLFERYYQVPGSKEKGTGLGLAISKEFIEAQHGKVWVESKPGKGSTFSFLLPGA